MGIAHNIPGSTSNFECITYLRKIPTYIVLVRDAQGGLYFRAIREKGTRFGKQKSRLSDPQIRLVFRLVQYYVINPGEKLMSFSKPYECVLFHNTNEDRNCEETINK